jgi:hypothetical protein
MTAYIHSERQSNSETISVGEMREMLRRGDYLESYPHVEHKPRACVRCGNAKPEFWIVNKIGLGEQRFCNVCGASRPTNKELLREVMDEYGSPYRAKRNFKEVLFWFKNAIIPCHIETEQEAIDLIYHAGFETNPRLNPGFMNDEYETMRTES